MKSDEWSGIETMIAGAWPFTSEATKDVLRRQLGHYDAGEVYEALGWFIDSDESGRCPPIGKIKSRIRETRRARDHVSALPPGIPRPWYSKLQTVRYTAWEKSNKRNPDWSYQPSYSMGNPLFEMLEPGGVEKIRAEVTAAGLLDEFEEWWSKYSHQVLSGDKRALAGEDQGVGYDPDRKEYYSKLREIVY